jgi:toxin ParE1/3/4
MSKPNYSITKRAENDLADIWLYTFHQWSNEQADRYINLIIDEIEYLAKKPKAARAIDNIREGYRVSKVKSHLLFYRQLADTTIEIVRVLHERMDVQKHLEE